jgi:ER membrane protein complex subunit 1
VAATAYGKVFGIDSSNGDILWSRVLGYGWAAEVGARIIPVRFFVTKTVGDGSNPEVVLVTQRRAENVSVLRVVWLGSDY